MAKYEGAGIGIERMNQIMQLLLFHSMTIAEITEEMELSRRMVCKYLAKLESIYKIRYTRPETGKQGGKLKVYSLVFGAMPIDQKQPKYPPTRPRKLVKEKTGPKPRADAKKSQNVANPCIRTIPAQQVGMMRDPYTAALFGAAQRASA